MTTLYRNENDYPAASQAALVDLPNLPVSERPPVGLLLACSLTILCGFSFFLWCAYSQSALRLFNIVFP